MSSTTTLKLPAELKARIATIAKQTGRSPHSLMVEAIERQTARVERMREFVKEALAADKEIHRTGEIYAAADVHVWLERLAGGRRPPRPKQWRK
jgi:predicted transcriptional regulator